MNTQHSTIKQLLEEQEKYKEIKSHYDQQTEQLDLKNKHLKMLTDEVKQLQDKNEYRKEVARLEKVVEENEIEIRSLSNELLNDKEKMKKLGESRAMIIEERMAYQEFYRRKHEG